MHKLETTKRTSHTGRDDRATSEQCLDPRTRLILFKMLSTGFLQLIDGCLSTGKEANVYYAKAGTATSTNANTPAINLHGNMVEMPSLDDPMNATNPKKKKKPTLAQETANAVDANVMEYAIKIYKTSILVFKDRDKYVSGEHRWRRGYCKYSI